MKRRPKKGFPFCIFLSAALLFLSDPHAFSSEKTPPDLNILLVTIDTIRPDRLSCYSDKYLKTPHMDGLAEEGMVFTRAFAHNPLTLPSHTNILLGATPLYHGIHDNSKFRLHDDFYTLAEYLKEKGYATSAFVGAFPLDSRFGLNQGFDVYDDYYGSKSSQEFAYAERRAEEVIKASLKWLKKQRGKWFTWIHLWDPHQPYSPPQPFLSTFQDDLYSGEVAYVDQELGRLFEYLRREGAADNTLIILTGDHGESLGEHGESTHGYFAYNSTLWVPLIMAGPGIRAGRSRAYVSHADIFPTICDILEQKKPPFLQGISLVPLINGGKINKRVIYFESLHAHYNRNWAPLRGFIEQKKKYIQSPIPELYELEKDFDEQKNLAQKNHLSSYQKKLKKIQKRLSSPQRAKTAQKMDRETRQKLESLGYVSSFQAPQKAHHGPEDDLKTLLPVQNKFTRAMVSYEKGRISEGINLLKEILQTRKDFDLAYCRLAVMLQSQGQMREAVSIMEEGFLHNPRNYTILSTYGILLVEAGLFDKAIEILGQGIALIDYDPQLWNYLGVAHWRKGEHQKALDAYNKALDLDKNYAMVFNNLGSLYLSLFLKTKKAQDLEKATRNFKQAIHIDPQLASAYNGLGGVYKLMGKADEAVWCWEKSIQLDPDYDFPLYNLGISYLKKGNKDQALEYFEKYLELKKNSISSEERRKIEALIKECRK
ncbi:MAG: sulfatase-like hydrolase/transferase [Candidatus Aminicenantes bacterium]